jgi:hypothetical protein
MSLFDNTDVVVDMVLQFNDPFDMINFLKTNSMYSRYLVSKNFWYEVFERRYGYAYEGNDPRSAFIVQFRGADTPFKDINPKYHWIPYLLYFSGAWFDAVSGSISLEGIRESYHLDDSEQSKKTAMELAIMEVNNLSGLSKEDAESMIEDLEQGLTPHFIYDQNITIYTGTMEYVDPFDLFQLHDPMDIQLWELIESTGGSGHTTLEQIASNFEQSTIDQLGLKVRSTWGHGETHDYNQKIKDFIDLKIQEAHNLGVEETLREMSNILNSVEELDYGL